MTADLNGPDLGVLARGSDRRSQVIAEKLIEGVSLCTTPKPYDAAAGDALCAE